MKYIIAAPGGVATGGPELCHQLVRNLIDQGKNAFIYYYKTGRNERKAPEEFKHFNVPSINEFGHCDVLIVPEIRTDLLRKSNAKYKVIWWQSINNYYKYYLNGISIKRKFLGKNILSITDLMNSNGIYHLAQSYYAEIHLESLGIKNIYSLQDYLSTEFDMNPSSELRRDRILYNPKKGAHIYEEILPKLKKQFDFIPLIGFSRDELINLMRTSKIYLDLGEHPGMDRMPREAMMCGCIPLCRMTGSAANYLDVPIPMDYKLPRIVNEEDLEYQLKKTLRQYEEIYLGLTPYRDVILGQKERFSNQLKFLTENVFL